MARAPEAYIAMTTQRVSARPLTSRTPYPPPHTLCSSSGKSLKTLMSKGILQVHPPICDCPGCRISSPVVRTKSFCSSVGFTPTLCRQMSACLDRPSHPGHTLGCSSLKRCVTVCASGRRGWSVRVWRHVGPVFKMCTRCLGLRTITGEALIS